ncbi:hypothetical protein [Aquimarina aggregata]|uniref:hypothetical protein n=1 Tax=Aquimarina aggregata TaxID=1642818 RepID=UPI00249151EF|nr:hypothetical protein [Aquimarina aggregata]
MKTKKICVMLSIICAALLMASCVKDLDFDQSEDIVLTPIVELDFIFSKFDTNQFVDPSIDPAITVPEVVVDDTLNYDLLGSSFAVDNLERIELSFEFRNTIERDFVFEFGFLNEADQRIGPFFTLTANAGRGEGTTPVVTTETIVLDNATIRTLAPTKRLFSIIQVQNVNSGLRGVLDVRSKGTYFINYDL